MTHSNLTSTMASNGQITIPDEVRAQMRVIPGMRYCFEPQSDGSVVMRPMNGDVTKLTALLKPYIRRSWTVEEMAEVMEEAVAAEVVRWPRRKAAWRRMRWRRRVG